MVIDDTGSPHVITTRDDLLLDVSFDDVIDRVLDDHGLDRARFEDLVTTPLERLSRDEVTTLLEVRRALPAVTVDTVLQKIITPGQAFETLGPDVAARLMEPEQLERAAAQGGEARHGAGGFCRPGSRRSRLAAGGVVQETWSQLRHGDLPTGRGVHVRRAVSQRGRRPFDRNV